MKNPIRFTSVRRNEIKSKASANSILQVYNGADKPLYISTKDDIVQRASLILKDVSYVIEAHFEMTEKANNTDSKPKKSKASYDLFAGLVFSFLRLLIKKVLSKRFIFKNLIAG